MKLVILDRDGVINYESRAFIKSPDEWIPLPGSLEAIARFTKENYKVFITTNQSGVARGYFTEEILAGIHNKLKQEVEKIGGRIEHIYYCPHLAQDNCNCRKPLPGMFMQLSKDYNVDLQLLNPPYIGDSFRDMQVAFATGCKFYLTIGAGGDGKETLQMLNNTEKQQIQIVENLAQACEKILSCKD